MEIEQMIYLGLFLVTTTPPHRPPGSRLPAAVTGLGAGGGRGRQPRCHWGRPRQPEPCGAAGERAASRVPAARAAHAGQPRLEVRVSFVRL